MFWNTFQIVTGIIAPFLILGFLIWLLNELTILAQAKRLSLEAKLEEAKKAPPYDDVEVSQPPNPKMFTLRLVKNNEVVFEKSYDKNPTQS